MPNHMQLCNPEDALSKLLELVRAGIAHGYFRGKVIVRDAPGGRSEIILKAGKRFRYLIAKQ
jgi:hypothetical protein